MNTSARITYNPAQCGGRPCIRGILIRVSDVLGMLAEGVTLEWILTNFPDLEAEDIKARLRFTGSGWAARANTRFDS